jgi:hypothetical protein
MHKVIVLFSCLLMVIGCDDQKNQPAVLGDGSAPQGDMGASDMQPRDMVHSPDAGLMDDSGMAHGSCDEETWVMLAESGVSLRSWGQNRESPVSVGMTVMGTPCGFLSGVSDLPMLRIALTHNALHMWIQPLGLTSGLHRGQVDITASNGAVLETLAVEIHAWAKAPDDAPRYALLIGIDGMRADAFQVAQTPNMDRLAKAGDWTVEASTQLQGTTLSGPGWASILTGVDVDKHGVTSNAVVFLPPDYPSFLTRLRRDMGVRTAGALQWAPLLIMVGENALDEGTTGDHEMVTADMVRMIQSDYRGLFIHFDDVDHAGHATGFSIGNPEYIEAIEKVDLAIGQLVAAMMSREQVAQEEWLLVVTTDHGGRGTGHGPRDEEHRRIPFIVSGPSVIEGTMSGASHTDAAVTILAHMGHPLESSLNLDGRPRGVSGEFNCVDQIDNDGNGQLDCDDANCYATADCGGGLPESACQNNRDDDHDMLVDCADPDCAALPACSVDCVFDDLGSAVGRAVFSGDTSEESAVLGSSCGGETGPEKVFRWTAPNDGLYLFNTFDSNFDTVLTLRDGDCVAPEIQCNDNAFGSIRLDTPLPAQSAMRRAMVGGEVVTIILDSGTADGGEAVLDIIEVAEMCPDTDLGQVLGMSVAEGNSGAAPTRYLGSCAGTARDVLYRWTAPEAGEYTFDTFGSDYDTVLLLMEGACGEREVACNDDAQQLQSSVTISDVEAGAVYTLVVAGFRGRNGHHILNISRQ